METGVTTTMRHAYRALLLMALPGLAAAGPWPTPTAAPTPATVRRSAVKPPRMIWNANPELSGVSPQEYYRNLSADLRPFMAMPRRTTGKYDKLFATVGQAVEAGCAAIAAYQAYQSFAPSSKAPSRPVTIFPTPHK